LDSPNAMRWREPVTVRAAPRNAMRRGAVMASIGGVENESQLDLQVVVHLPVVEHGFVLEVRVPRPAAEEEALEAGAHAQKQGVAGDRVLRLAVREVRRDLRQA